MNKRAWFFLLFCAVIGIGSAPAQQDDAPPPPDPPFVQELPRDSAWKVTIIQKNQPAATPPPSGGSPVAHNSPHGGALLKEIKATRVGADMRMVKTWTDGSTTEEWRYQGYILLTQPYTPNVYVLGRSPDAAAMFPTMSDSTFPELGWLSAANYVKVDNIKGKSVYLFQDASVTTPALASGVNSKTALAQAHPDRRAWIDRATKLPVAFENGNEVRVYEYAEPPTAPLVLPEAFATALEQVKQNVGKLHHDKMKL